MIGPKPQFMENPEWELYKDDEDPFKLKEDAPEWLKKELAEYYNMLKKKAETK